MNASGSGSGTVEIPQFATGVKNFRGGLAIVGEKGPELVSLPKGSNVYPNTSGLSPSFSINIQNMIVREENDIYKIKRELELSFRSQMRGAGIV